MKTLLKIGAVLVVLFIIAVVVVTSNLDKMIKAGVETMGPEITGTSIKLDSVDLSLLSGQGELKGLVVGNPPGFQTERAFKLGDARVKVDLKSALTDKLIIEEILIDRPEITYEAGSSGSNLNKIQENVAAFAKKAGATGGAEPKAEKKDAGQKKVQINHFILKNAQVNASAALLKGKTLTVSLPDIHLKDIGKESQGVTMQQASSEMVAALNKSVLQAVSGSGKLLTKGAEALGEAAKSLGGEAGKAGSQAAEGLKGLFGK
jgi:hypothetical protein